MSLFYIFMKIMKYSECVLTDAAIRQIKVFFDTPQARTLNSFENADLVTQIADTILVEQSNRLSGIENPTDEMMSTIEEEDVTTAFSILSIGSDVDAESLKPDKENTNQINDNEESKQKPIGKNVYLTKKNVKAIAIYNKKTGITVLSGSVINKDCSSYYAEKRNAIMKGNENMQDGKIVLINNIHFRTPSGASDFVLGASTNGWTEWKTRKDNSLDDIYRKK